MSEKAKRVKKPKSKARKIFEWVVTGILAALFVVSGAAQIDGMVNRKNHYGQMIRFGMGAFIVKTDSMEPEYPVKTAIITKLKSLDDIYAEYTAGETVDVTFINVYSQADELADNPTDPVLTNRVTSGEAYGLVITHRVREIKVRENPVGDESKYVFIVAGINDQGMYSRQGQYQAFTEKELLGQVVVNNRFLGGVFGFISSVWGLLILLLVPAFYLVISSVMDLFKAFKEEPEGAAEGGGAAPAGLEGLSDKDRARLKQEMLEQMLAKKAEERAKAQAAKEETDEQA